MGAGRRRARHGAGERGAQQARAAGALGRGRGACARLGRWRAAQGSWADARGAEGARGTARARGAQARAAGAGGTASWAAWARLGRASGPAGYALGALSLF